MIDLLFVTYNRISYARKALARLLADPDETFALTIWDNGSTDGTREFLRDEINDPRIADVVFSAENVGQTAAIDSVWGRSRADLVAKVDDDCLVTPGWTRTLAEAHADIPALGVVACWHHMPEDFDERLSERKIRAFGRHRILCHPWTGGTGVVVKRDTFARLGPISDSATTRYWIRMAQAGFVNGYYYPLVFQEHMDDPRSAHFMYETDEAFAARLPVSARTTQATSIAAWDAVLRRDAVLLQTLSSDVRAYTGWRGLLSGVVGRLRGRRYNPFNVRETREAPPVALGDAR